MAIFVCGLLFYANGVAFNLISAPIFINDIIAYAALTVAVALSVIMLTIVIRDKRKGLFVKTQKSNVDSEVKLDQASDTVSSPAIAQESIEKVDSNDQVIQTIEVSDEVAAAVLPAAKISKRRSLFAAIIGIVVVLLVYVNIVAFGLFALPEYSMYGAAVGAAGLTGVAFVVALAEKRKDAFAKIQKANVVSAVKESNEPLETVPASVDFQESTSVVETDEADIQTLNVSDESQVFVLPKAKSSKKRNCLIFIIAIAVGLLFFANCVAFGLIGLPGYFAYAFVAGACALTVIAIAAVLVGKRKGALSKGSIAEVVGAIKESNAAPETPDTVSSPTITQTSADKVESDEQSIQTIEAFDEAPDTVSSPIFAQTSEEKVESDVVTIETVKVPDETPAPIAPPSKVFGKRSLFVIIISFTVGLLFFANAVAFGLISLPTYVIYAAVAVAVALASISVAVILRGKIKVLGNRIKRFVAEPDIQEILNEVKEPDQAIDTAPAPVIAQTTTKKVDTYAELFRQLGFQNARNKIAVDKAEQEQLPKKPVIRPTTIICPACRKEFNLPIYERDYIVDFGTPKKSNLIEQCPICKTSIPLKRKGVFEEEDIWKE